MHSFPLYEHGTPFSARSLGAGWNRRETAAGFGGGGFTTNSTDDAPPEARVLGVAFVRKLDIYYHFDNGELRAVRQGVVLWREDLAGLKRVTATLGRSGIISMKLIWPDHRRRMELYRSVQAAVESKAERGCEGGSRLADGRTSR